MNTPLKTDVPVAGVAGELQAAVPRLLADQGVRGASVALIRDGRCAWAGGFGVKNAATGDPVDADTVFEAYSLTKPLVAYRALHLCRQGALDLDRPLGDYLPAPYVADPRGAGITLRMALTHTSGLPDDPEDTGHNTLDFEPGRRWSYSTAGFYYIARVIAHVAGQSLARDMQVNLLDPLYMGASSFVWRERSLPHMAQGHDHRGAPEATRRITTADADSLLATPADYARFMTHIIRPRDGFGLDANGAAAMVRGQAAVGDNLSWGLGWGVQHTAAGDCFWQFGGGPGAPFQNFALAFREHGIGIVIMTNDVHGGSLFADLVALAVGGAYPVFPWGDFIDQYFGGVG